MASSVSICSNALLKLGDSPINSFADEDSNTAVACANIYPSVRDYMLRAHPWNCATKRVILSPDTETPAFGYAYQFTLPGDWLRTLQVGEDEEPIDFVNESSDDGAQVIRTDETTLKLRYLFRNDNENTWDAMFVYAMELAMEAALAYFVTQSTSKEELCLKKLQDYLKLARAVDGSEDPPATLGDFPLLNSRY